MNDIVKVNASAISRWAAKSGPCIGDHCVLEEREYRIAAIADGVVSFVPWIARVASDARFCLDAKGNMAFSGTHLRSPNALVSSLAKLQGDRPRGAVSLPDGSQTSVGCRRFKAG